MVITEYEHWLVVRQSRRRRIYRVTLVATVSRTLRTPLGARRTRRVVSCNYGGFISGACVSPRGVYAARVARQRGMGIPGDRVNRVETYQTHTTGVSGASPADEPTVTTMADTQPADKTHK